MDPGVINIFYIVSVVPDLVTHCTMTTIDDCHFSGVVRLLFRRYGGARRRGERLGIAKASTGG